LIKQALEQGYNESDVQRHTTEDLRRLLTPATQPQRHRRSRHSSRGSRASSLSRRNSRRRYAAAGLRDWPEHKGPPPEQAVVQSFNPLHPPQPDRPHEDTLVDVSHLDAQASPLVQRIRRFHELHKMTVDLVQACDNNRKVLQSASSRLDKEDLQVLRHNLEQARRQHQTAYTEMQEICQALKDDLATRQVEYRDLNQQWFHVNNDVREHFLTRIQKLEQQVKRVASLMGPG